MGKLTLSGDPSVVKRAKDYAARRGTSVSSLVEGYLDESSDIDLLVELQPKTFDAYMDVKLFLEKVLGRKVDLVLAGAVKPRLRSVILEEAVHASRL